MTVTSTFMILRNSSSEEMSQLKQVHRGTTHMMILPD